MVGLDGAPVTNAVSINPLNNSKLGGVSIINDRIGPTQETRFLLIYLILFQPLKQ
jgi:hypothetical protein